MEEKILTDSIFNDNEYYDDSFKEVLGRVSSKLRIIKPNQLKVLTTDGNQNGDDLRELIGEKNLAKSETEALEVLATVMSNEESKKDDNLNIVYYLDRLNQLRFLSCRCYVDTSDKNWFCYDHHIPFSPWKNGFRVFYCAV